MVQPLIYNGIISAGLTQLNYFFPLRQDMFMHACMKIKNQYSNKPIITFLRRQLKSNRLDQQSADNMLDPLARGLHADVSLFCFFCFYTKRKVFESLNVIKEMVSVQRATIKL